MSGIQRRHAREKSLLRAVKSLTNRGDPSLAFQMSHLGSLYLHSVQSIPASVLCIDLSSELVDALLVDTVVK